MLKINVFLENVIIIMEKDMKDMKVNRKTVSRKELEYIIIIMEINMKVNREMVKGKELEYIIFLMEINMRVNGKMILGEELEYILF